MNVLETNINTLEVEARRVQREITELLTRLKELVQINNTLELHLLLYKLNGTTHPTKEGELAGRS